MTNAAEAMKLSVALDEWLAKSEAAARLKFIDICLEAAEGVIRKTPVDTGFCRAMWSVSINAEPAMKPVGRPADVPQQSAEAAAAKAMGEVTAKALAVKITDRVWIYNPTEYAPLLEQGSSKQAPLGMVGITLASMRAKYAA